jgi:hypothetical protein
MPLYDWTWAVTMVLELGKPFLNHSICSLGNHSKGCRGWETDSMDGVSG